MRFLDVYLSTFICCITNHKAHRKEKKQWNRKDKANSSYSRHTKRENKNKVDYNKYYQVHTDNLHNWFACKYVVSCNKIHKYKETHKTQKFKKIVDTIIINSFTSTAAQNCVVCVVITGALFFRYFSFSSSTKVKCGIFYLCSVPDPYLIFGNRYYVHRMNIEGGNRTRIPQLHAFVHVIDIDDKVDRWICPITVLLMISESLW